MTKKIQIKKKLNSKNSLIRGIKFQWVFNWSNFHMNMKLSFILIYKDLNSSKIYNNWLITYALIYANVILKRMHRNSYTF